MQTQLLLFDTREETALNYKNNFTIVWHQKSAIILQVLERSMR